MFERGCCCEKIAEKTGAFNDPVGASSEIEASFLYWRHLLRNRNRFVADIGMVDRADVLVRRIGLLCSCCLRDLCEVPASQSKRSSKKHKELRKQRLIQKSPALIGPGLFWFQRLAFRLCNMGTFGFCVDRVE